MTMSLPTGILVRLLLAFSVACVAVNGALAEAQVSVEREGIEIRLGGPDEIQLEFNATRNADNVISDCGGGGLRGGIECGVSKRFDDSETQGGGRINVRLRVQIQPEITDGPTPEARLVGGPAGTDDHRG